MSIDFHCPYCGAPHEVCHDDGHGMDEDELHQETCGSCDKSFVFTTYISVNHTARKADCLNDGRHQWKPTVTFPKRYARMRCAGCGDERQPTDAERDRHDLKDPS